MPQTNIEIEAATLEEARALAKAQLPEDHILLAERIVSDGEPETSHGVGNTTELALADARSRIPPNAEILKTQTSPEGTKVLTVGGFDESSASARLEIELGPTEKIQNLVSTVDGKKGFLGIIGKTPNQYKFQVLQQAMADITYKVDAKISVDVGMWNVPLLKLKSVLRGLMVNTASLKGGAIDMREFIKRLRSSSSFVEIARLSTVIGDKYIEDEWLNFLKFEPDSQLNLMNIQERVEKLLSSKPGRSDAKNRGDSSAPPLGLTATTPNAQTVATLGAIRCSKCTKEVRRMSGGLFQGEPALEQWFGNVCLPCSKIYCHECIKLGAPTPCPQCGEPTKPAQKGILQEAGIAN